MNPQELRQQMAAKAEEARAIYATAETEKRAVTEDEKTRYQALIDEAKALKAEAERLEELEKLGGYKPNASQPQGEQRNGQFANGRGSGEGYTRTPDTAEAIYCRYIRTGDEGAQRELNPAVMAEYRASNDTTMNITTAADGGDLVPVGHYQGIIERARPAALYTRLGLRQIPGVGTTVNVPIDNEADSGEFVSTAESAAFDRDAPAVSKVAMTLVKYTKKVDLTYELLQDEDSRLMDFLNSYVASGFAATMNKLLVTEVLADGTAGLTLDSATAIGATEIPELLYKLSAEYADSPNVHWLMKRSTEGYLRGLRDTNLWTFAPPSVSGSGRGVDWLLWGIPAHSATDMPAIGAGNKSLIVGDFSRVAYRLDPSMTFLRDPYSRAGNGEVILHYYFRADIEVLQAGALQYATHPTA